MAVTLREDVIIKSDEDCTVILVKELVKGYLLNHKMCGEMFIYVDKKTTPVCSICKGKIIFPKSDWCKEVT